MEILMVSLALCELMFVLVQRADQQLLAAEDVSLTQAWNKWAFGPEPHTHTPTHTRWLPGGGRYTRAGPGTDARFTFLQCAAR